MSPACLWMDKQQSTQNALSFKMKCMTNLETVWSNTLMIILWLGTHWIWRRLWDPWALNKPCSRYRGKFKSVLIWVRPCSMERLDIKCTRQALRMDIGRGRSSWKAFLINLTCSWMRYLDQFSTCTESIVYKKLWNMRTDQTMASRQLCSLSHRSTANSWHWI